MIGDEPRVLNPDCQRTVGIFFGKGKALGSTNAFLAGLDFNGRTVMQWKTNTSKALGRLHIGR